MKASQEGSPRGLYAVLLPTLECSLACDYCFEPRVPLRWSADQTKFVLRKVVSLATGRGVEELTLHWQGGEPLLLDDNYWKTVFAEARTLAASRGLVLRQTMQTNLVGYRSSFAAVVHEYLGGQLGSSFEVAGGRREALGGYGGFERRWLGSFRQATRDGIKVGVLSLVTKRALEMGAVACVDELRERHGIGRLRFVLPFASPRGGYWLDPEATGEFLADAYSYWRREGGDDRIHLKPFAFLRARLAGQASSAHGFCVFARNCTNVGMAITPTGQVALCDSFAGADPDAGYGNVFEHDLQDILQGPAHAHVSRQVDSLIGRECAGCRYLFLCFGGCLARARQCSAGTAMRDHYCKTYLCLFDTIERLG